MFAFHDDRTTTAKISVLPEFLTPFSQPLFQQVGLDVEDRGPVSHVETPDVYDVPLHPKYLQNRHAYGVGTHGRADAEDTHASVAARRSLAPVRWRLSQQIGRESGALVEVEDNHDPLTRLRSEERRVGKECRSRWSPYH